jgi:hypothetical protein
MDLCIIGKNGNYRDLNSFVHALVAMGQSEEEAVDKVKTANLDLLNSFGCNTNELIKEGLEFFMSLSLQQTFNSWSNDDEGSSGISARALLPEATKPGAILALVGLLRSHPDAKASGSVNISYSNPVRGARR